MNIKILGKKVILLIFSSLIILYIIGFVDARKKVKPFYEAQKLMNEASQVRSQLKEVLDKDRDKEMEFIRKITSIYELAAKLDLHDFPDLQAHIKEEYQINKELLELDEKIISGQLVVTEEQTKKIVEEYTARRAKNNFIRTPFWMSFFLVSNPDIAR